MSARDGREPPRASQHRGCGHHPGHDPLQPLLGVAFPPVAGIMIADYYVIRRHRAVLERARSAGSLPPRVESLNLRPLVAWAGGVAAGYLIHAGIPSINALLCGFLAHVALNRKNVAS